MANASLQANVAQEIARRKVAEQLMQKSKTLTDEVYPEQAIGFTKDEPNSDAGIFGIGDSSSGADSFGGGVVGGTGFGVAPSSGGDSASSAPPMSAGAVFGSNLGFGPIGHMVASVLLPGYTAANMIAGIMNSSDNSSIGPTTGSVVGDSDAAQSFAVTSDPGPVVSGQISGDGDISWGADGSWGYGGDSGGGVGGDAGGDAGGGGGGGGGKIVCTAMNQAYGFGSFRQSVWLEYSAKRLTKQHEIGYHRIFRPLVQYAFHSGSSFAKKGVRKFLEYIMRLRTADIRAEMRGKNPYPIRRVIRRTCEYICYLAGKL